MIKNQFQKKEIVERILVRKNLINNLGNFILDEIWQLLLFVDPLHCQVWEWKFSIQLGLTGIRGQRANQHHVVPTRVYGGGPSPHLGTSAQVLLDGVEIQLLLGTGNARETEEGQFFQRCRRNLILYVNLGEPVRDEEKKIIQQNLQNKSNCTIFLPLNCDP